MMGRECFVHRHRDDVPLEVHHVFPKGLGGPDVTANRVTVCSNGHGSVHSLLDKMLKAHTEKVPWRVRRRYGRKVRRLAAAGYLAVTSRAIVIP
jgi:5-methylcytosine-specific restriction endonuclease McrA